ncbi:enoyl-acyl carrier reductase [Plasmodium yoelii]|uniref:Enoyl-acyl carrier reductase n=3 Tax=Plasmodium yoelii TaxID=5861 RepID=A0AAF0B5Z9_PLAYO|nr:enoyl-acyl carrier reductase [Plasmodium yoelii]EAA15619.1 enoyl-acyl carrier reductase [Plasmodium yoelii yoelii]WBY59356.1 enoyl-acyl carrier reductase [Plasmodium yoelii yoelii]CDU19495.1 enoyl-acyl carrier reductase [Plasmodium yoelii]VTZ80131.1 enoyl-acyl carrier reductase [Plasmodium yoelii]|eukprot:XP_724054.1 enoyl-acyl carrier reductase [Plasmodium yoelii]
MYKKVILFLIISIFNYLKITCFTNTGYEKKTFPSLRMNKENYWKNKILRKNKNENNLRINVGSSQNDIIENIKNGSENGSVSGSESGSEICFIAGVGDSNGYGWGIAKELSKRNVKVIFGVWPPVYNIFIKNLESGKFDKDMIINNDNLKRMEILDVLPLDAGFDNYDDIDEDTKNNKRYNNLKNYSIEEVANLIYNKYGKISMLVHSLANGREVQKSLLDTSRDGYLDAISKSSYSLISLCKHFCKFMNPGGSIVSLTYQASQKVVPGYGGGMSSAKAALESDTRVLAYYLGRKYNIRINTISAGPLKSRAATAINKFNNNQKNNMNSSGENDKQNYSFIDYAIDYSEKYAPLKKKLLSTDVGSVASFLLSKESSAVTGQTIYVDNGLNIMFGPDDLFQASDS